MPRLRRRHHSRSRSRSHSHDRDREPKRRRVESPDLQHRRSVSVDSDVSPQSPKSPKDLKELETTYEHSNVNKDITTTSNEKEPEQSDQEEAKDSNTTHEESAINLTDIDDKENDKKESEKTSKLADVTPQKTLSPMQLKKMLDSQKKREEKQRERERLKQEKEEQRLKERKEKEEQRRKEKEEKEESKRKEKEEKEELKRKEKEEKEDQKRKEREEKQKEREEKEELKRKEKEDKEEQRRKEKEQKEMKRQQELEEKNKEKKKKEEQLEREKTAFVSFFLPSRQSRGSTTSEVKKPEEFKTLTFMPFAVKSDMRLAPITRTNISDEQKKKLVDKLLLQTDTVSYLNEIKSGKKLGSSTRTWRVEDDDVIIVGDTDIGECVEEQPKAKKMRMKLLKFHENQRPAYFGTWRKQSKKITPRNPYVTDTAFFDYEVDSDDDWVEEEPGESLQGSDDEDKDNETDDYEVDNEFFVPHGYLSDEEIAAEENFESSPTKQKEKLELLQMEFDEEMKSKTERIKPRLIGCFWEKKLPQKVNDAIYKFLEDRKMIMNGPIFITKEDLVNPNKLNTSKQNTPNKKVLSEHLMPDFINLIHGNVKKKGFLANEFLNYLSSKQLETSVSKNSLVAQIKQIAKWQKCPAEGKMFNKYCWYVSDEIRNQYNVDPVLPNTWIYTTKLDDSFSAKTKVTV